MHLENKFNINYWLFLVPLIVVLLIIKKVPAIPSLMSGVILGGIFAIIFQPEIIKEISQVNTLNFKEYYMVVMNSIASEIQINTDNDLMNNLLNSTGMKGMLSTIWLVICAMSFRRSYARN